MANFTDALKKVVGTIAPTLGAALGGPLGGTAGTMIAKALGKEDAPEQELEATLLKGDPETLLKLKQAEIDFQQFLKDADIKIQSLENEDRANAREREKTLHDWTPSVLALAIVLGFFAVVAFILKWGLPQTGDQPLLLLLGTLGSGFIAVLNYYLGSSAGSASKQKTIDAVMSKGK